MNSRPPEVNVGDSGDAEFDDNELLGELNIGVYARVKQSKGRDDSIVVSRRFDQQKDLKIRNLEFTLDWVFDSDASQEDVYSIVAEQRVMRVLQGYNVCLLCYGQTGSGKTYTMFGPDSVIDDWMHSEREQRGLAPRAISAFFDGLQHLPDEKQFLVTVSYVEVYNDQCNDLLGGRKGLHVREAHDGHVSVDGLTKEVVSTAAEVMETLQRGNSNRYAKAASKQAAASKRRQASGSPRARGTSNRSGPRRLRRQLIARQSSLARPSVPACVSMRACVCMLL